MAINDIEDEISTLSYVINTFNTNISYLETISFKDGRYNLYIAQLIEICTNLESKVDDLEEMLNKFSQEDFQEAYIERLKKDERYNEIDEM